MTKQIHVNVGYGALSDKDVATQGVAVVDGMTNNPKFANPHVDVVRQQRPLPRKRERAFSAFRHHHSKATYFCGDAK